MMATDLGSLLAQGMGMHGNGVSDSGWWMGGMMLWMAIFWIAIVCGIVWLIYASVARRPRRAGTPALKILDRRLADGAISLDEYVERKAAIADGASWQPAPDGASHPGGR